MTILKYNLIDPAVNKTKPYYNFQTDTFVFPIKHKYNWFVQAYDINEVTRRKEYFLLLGKEKFDDGCRRCDCDGYGKCRVHLTDEFKEFVISECKSRGNIIVEYSESDEGYDAYNVH